LATAPNPEPSATSTSLILLYRVPFRQINGS